MINDHEKIELRRGNDIVRSFFGTFGIGLKETRLTAGLGFIISLAPERFLPFFGFVGTASNIAVESYHKKKRSDILITTEKGIGVIEAKIDSTDPHLQSLNYNGKWRVHLTSYIPAPSEQKRNTKYISWQQLGNHLLLIEKKSTNVFQKKLINEYIKYLEENGLMSKGNAVEIYAREINERITLELFLKGHFYCCDLQKSSRIGEALYFAPHFGQLISEVYPGIGVGISYLAKIENVVLIETYEDLLRSVKSQNGSAWAQKHNGLFEPLKKEWTWEKGQKRHVLWLSKPTLAFNPPIKKTNLQKGSGWLSKRTFTFEELFLGWKK